MIEIKAAKLHSTLTREARAKIPPLRCPKCQMPLYISKAGLGCDNCGLLKAFDYQPTQPNLKPRLFKQTIDIPIGKRWKA